MRRTNRRGVLAPDRGLASALHGRGRRPLSGSPSPLGAKHDPIAHVHSGRRFRHRLWRRFGSEQHRRSSRERTEHPALGLLLRHGMGGSRGDSCGPAFGKRGMGDDGCCHDTESCRLVLQASALTRPHTAVVLGSRGADPEPPRRAQRTVLTRRHSSVALGAKPKVVAEGTLAGGIPIQSHEAHLVEGAVAERDGPFCGIHPRAFEIHRVPVGDLDGFNGMEERLASRAATLRARSAT